MPEGRAAARSGGRSGALAYPDEVTTAVCPGSFDPVTLGHLDVVRRARSLFDEVVVAVGVNATKMPLLDADTRVALLRDAVADMPASGWPDDRAARRPGQ